MIRPQEFSFQGLLGSAIGSANFCPSGVTNALQLAIVPLQKVTKHTPFCNYKYMEITNIFTNLLIENGISTSSSIRCHNNQFKLQGIVSINPHSN